MFLGCLTCMENKFSPRQQDFKRFQTSLSKLPQQSKNTNARFFLYYLKYDHILMIAYLSCKDIKLTYSSKTMCHALVYLDYADYIAILYA